MVVTSRASSKRSGGSTVGMRLASMCESATPLTNLRFTRNAKGSIYGYAPTVDNVFLSRLPNRTAVPGLFLASAWGAPGGGYGGVIEGGKDAFAEVSAFLSA